MRWSTGLRNDPLAFPGIAGNLELSPNLSSCTELQDVRLFNFAGYDGKIRKSSLAFLFTWIVQQQLVREARVIGISLRARRCINEVAPAAHEPSRFPALRGKVIADMDGSHT